MTHSLNQNSKPITVMNLLCVMVWLSVYVDALPVYMNSGQLNLFNRVKSGHSDSMIGFMYRRLVPRSFDSDSGSDEDTSLYTRPVPVTLNPRYGSDSMNKPSTNSWFNPQTKPDPITFKTPFINPTPIQSKYDSDSDSYYSNTHIKKISHNNNPTHRSWKSRPDRPRSSSESESDTDMKQRSKMVPNSHDDSDLSDDDHLSNSKSSTQRRPSPHYQPSFNQPVHDHRTSTTHHTSVIYKNIHHHHIVHEPFEHIHISHHPILVEYDEPMTMTTQSSQSSSKSIHSTTTSSKSNNPFTIMKRNPIKTTIGLAFIATILYSLHQYIQNRIIYNTTTTPISVNSNPITISAP